MKNTKQSINGDRNIQVIHNGNVINTKTVKNVTEVIYDETKNITDSEAHSITEHINKMIDDICYGNESCEKQKLYALCYAHLKKIFHCTTYKLIPAGNFNKAIKELNKLFMSKLMPMLRKQNPVRYSELMRKAIYQAARKRNIENDIYDIAYEKLQLKKNLSSLKELSPTRLNKLYTCIVSIKKQK